MDVCMNDIFLNVRTSFSATHNLVQVFNIGYDSLTANHPVDFHISGLQRKGHEDIWHIDRLLSYATDEVAPLCVLNDYIGANHGYACAVCVTMHGHNKTYADIGSRWQDDANITWTLLRVIDSNKLLFLSDNIGISEIDFQFANAIVGKLQYVDNGEHTTNVSIEHQVGAIQLVPAIRHERREIHYWKNSKQYEVTEYHTACDRVVITEEYTCYNPVTVSQTIYHNRPEGGYLTEPDLAVGNAMFRYNVLYSILDNGTVICDFKYTFLQDIYLTKIMGIMHQEKADAFGGGVWRYIPKLNPITDECGCRYDFSRPINTTSGPFPYNLPLTPDTWSNPTLPPDRQIDIMCKPDGGAAVAFATGYLPLYDGECQKRVKNITEAGMLVHTRKTYPTFLSKPRGVVTCAKTIQGSQEDNYISVHGVGYKVYYEPADRRSHYVVEYNGLKYHYFDFWNDTVTDLCILLPKAELLVQERDGNVDWDYKEDILTVTGTKGYLILVENI